MVMVTAKSLPCFIQIYEKSILRKKNTCMALSINRFPFLLLSRVGKKQISLAFSHVLINNALLYHSLANWLAHNKKMTEKSVFLWGLEFWNDVTIVPSVLFWVSRFCTSPEVIWHFWYIKTWGRKIAIEKICFAILISTLGRFNQANKKICRTL